MFGVGHGAGFLRPRLGLFRARAIADNVRHVEMFFDPQGHTSRGISFATVLEGLTTPSPMAGRKLGLKASLIMCFLRHLDEGGTPSGRSIARSPSRTASSVSGSIRLKWGNPPGKFKRVFDRAREAGFFLTAHAGEEGPAELRLGSARRARVARIDHGVRAIEDEP